MFENLATLITGIPAHGIRRNPRKGFGDAICDGEEQLSTRVIRKSLSRLDDRLRNHSNVLLETVLVYLTFLASVARTPLNGHGVIKVLRTDDD